MAEGLSTFDLTGAAPAAKKGGSLSPPVPLLVRRAVTPGERGNTRAQPRFALSHGTREIRVTSRPMRRFWEVPNYNGEGSAL